MRRENSGIDLLSIVASERNEEIAAEAAKRDSGLSPPTQQKGSEKRHIPNQQDMES
jgi:hypothetical protein